MHIRQETPKNQNHVGKEISAVGYCIFLLLISFLCDAEYDT